MKSLDFITIVVVAVDFIVVSIVEEERNINSSCQKFPNRESILLYENQVKEIEKKER